MCNFDIIRTPWGPTGGLCQKNYFLSMCLRGLLVVLFCRIHGLDVQCASLVQSNYYGAQKGALSKIPPQPPPPPLSSLFATEKLFLDKLNALKWSTRMYEEVFLLFSAIWKETFWRIFAFSVVLGHYITYTPYYGYNKFDWLTLILRSNWTCRIWFWILFLRPFCIILSDFVYLLPFSNNFLHKGFTLTHSRN